MKPFVVHGNLDVIAKKEPVVLTFGNFDGVHLGHQFLLKNLRQKSNGKPVVVVTFDPHPQTYFSPENKKQILTCLDEKVSLLLDNGADVVVVQNFNQEFASLTADVFCANWLDFHFKIDTVALGYDLCYGRGRSGNFEHMRNYGSQKGWRVISVEPLSSQDESEKNISSSLIRAALNSGDMQLAQKLLGRPYRLAGFVTKGDMRGQLLGFPTANLGLSCDYVIPKYGVYACHVEIDNNGKWLEGVMNCGVRPTVSEGLKLQIEAHLFDFSSKIYDKPMKIYPRSFIRPEMKFTDFEHLKRQIFADVEQAKILLSVV